MVRLVNKTIYTLAKTLRQIGVNFNEAGDVRVLEMKKQIQNIGGQIELKIEQYPDGSWTAESTNIDGIITGGHNVKKMPALIKDSIFTYFSIPPHLCNDALLRADNEPVTTKQRVADRLDSRLSKIKSNS